MDFGPSISESLIATEIERSVLALENVLSINGAHLDLINGRIAIVKYHDSGKYETWYPMAKQGEVFYEGNMHSPNIGKTVVSR